MATLPPGAFGLSALQKAVSEAWSRRSEGEQAAWRAESEKMNCAPKAALEQEVTVVTARQRGALSGWVEPLDLLKDLPVDNVHALLDSIAISFDRSRGRAGWRWQMRAGPRAAIFRGLVDPGDTLFTATLTEAVADANHVPTDEAGQFLRQIVAHGGTVDPAMLVAAPDDEPVNKRAHLEAALQALGWAGIAAAQHAFPPEPVQQARDEVRRALATTICASNCQRLLKAGFYGYERELARLNAFAVEAFDDPRVPVLRVEGVGGAGKSTLLAALVRDQFRHDDPGSPIVVQADFDRLVFRNGGELELSFDVTRQIGVQVPEVDAPLRRLSDEILAQRASLSEEMKQGGAALEAMIRIAASFDYQAGEILRSKGLGSRPVLLLLDTFEEWRRPGSEEQPTTKELLSQRLVRLVDWVGTMKSQMGLAGLRVVISGRVTLDAFTPALKLVRPIRLKGIAKTKARKLLTDCGLKGREADRLLEIIGGGTAKRWIPLTLHIAERMVRDLDPKKRAAFLEGDDVIDAKLDESVRQGTLYKRYLDHMAQGEVRDVALPGLALRRVTVPIIQHVLAEPCGLGEVDEARARSLFDQLGKEVWLVQPDGDALVHRPEIRSVMLRMMVEDEKLAPKIDKLHIAAIAWYREGEGRKELPEDAARQEALYHELALLPDDSDLPPLIHGPIDKGSRLYADLRALLPSREDFGPRLAAQLRFAVEEWVPQDEASQLPDSSKSAYVREHGQRMVRRGDAEAAVRFFEATGGKEPQWLAQAQVDAVRWDKRVPSDDDYVERLGDRPDLALSVRLKHHVLRAFLARDYMTLARIVVLFAGHAGERSEPLTQRSNPTAIIDTVYMLLVAIGADKLVEQFGEGPHFLMSLAVQGRGGRGAFDDWLRAGVLVRVFGFDEQATQTLRRTSPQMVVAGMLRPNLELVSHYRSHVETLGLPAAAGAVAEYQGLVSTPGDSTQMLFAWPAKVTERFGQEKWPLENPLTRLPPSVELLRVGDPELRPAIRVAIGHAFSSKSDFQRLGDILSPVMPVTPSDLTSQAFAEGWKVKGQVLIRLVEFLDRAGVMAQALETLCRAAPDDPLLEMVRDGHDRWNRASCDLLAQVVADAAAKAVPSA